MAGRPLRGMSFVELLAAVVLVALLASVTWGAVGWWQREGNARVRAAAVPFIAEALRQYIRTYGQLPDLTDPGDSERWLTFYTPPGSPLLPDGQPRTLPEGMGYRLERDYVPASLLYGESPGEIALTGTGCDPDADETSCSLTIRP